MDQLNNKLSLIDWKPVSASLHSQGYAEISKLLSKEECLALINNYNDHKSYRKTVVMERHRFGIGEYRYFNYPLPHLIQQLRKDIYPKLVPIANQWMRMLNVDTRFPSSHEKLQNHCHTMGQIKPTPLILKYGKGGYNTLHQDLYGEVFFPIQAVLFLNDPQHDYSGGEFVMTQQIPRAQSQAIVLNPGIGDVLIFTTKFYPKKGNRGYYRVNVKHGVSKIHSGERYALGIIFHDAHS